MASPRSSAAGPIPERSSSAGDSIAPALTTTSAPAIADATRPSRSHSTPTQRVPSSSSLWTWAPVITRRLSAPITGRR